ncbi:MAG: hypothetical protein KDK97_11515 [Verrucomicrobiales bacterium]|nr:hypothetical protein [Verrucomicrobiales bacterium]
MTNEINFDSLWASVTSEPNHRRPHSVHGPDHWRRVERNACILAARTGANINVVRLFALFHDSRRLNDGHDPDHGRRGADFATSVRGKWFDLPDDDFALLQYACIWHTDGHHHKDPTIGTCWDADRLDLGRVGMIPDPAYMSTPFGAEIAAHGVIQPWLHLADSVLGCAATHHLK